MYTVTLIFWLLRQIYYVSLYICFIDTDVLAQQYIQSLQLLTSKGLAHMDKKKRFK